MPARDIEPLEPGHWVQRIAKLARRNVDDEPAIERILRQAFHLIQLAPRPLRHLVHCTCEEAEFEALLHARAFETAVLRLLGNQTGYSLTRPGGEERVTAQVWYRDEAARHSASGRSPAPVLLRAWLACNAAIGSLDEAVPLPPAARRLAGEAATEH